MKIFIRYVIIAVLPLYISGCAETGSSELSPQIATGEHVVETFTFGLPSVTTFAVDSLENQFFDGKKSADPLNKAPHAFIIDSAPSGGGRSVSLISKWLVVFDPYRDQYRLKNGPYTIAFVGLEKQRPTVQSLRKIFGKWIFFEGDDPNRVHEVDTVNSRFPRELVFNDGRPPRETIAPDIRAPRY